MTKLVFYGIVIQFFAITFLLAADIYAQRKSIDDIYLNIELKNSSIKHALKVIEKETGFFFAYSNASIDKNVKIDFSSKEVSLREILSYLSQNSNLQFKRVNETINISRGENSRVVVTEYFSESYQERKVTGRVVGDGGDGLPGVNVILKGTPSGTVTDVDGYYALSVPEEGAVLVFSSVGYVQEEITVGAQTVINISLVPDITALEEIVVVGYGTQKKSDLTGAISSLKSQVLEERPITNVAQALQGNVAGVHATSNMRPGELPAIRVRGNRSINASNDPLYVIDGIPVISQLGVTSFSLNDLSPNDIQSVEILKDASATAIYGSRGANGVIIVSTKKGAKGQLKVNYSATVSLDSYKSMTDWMNGGEYVDIWRQSLINGRQYGPAGNADLNTPAQQWYPDPFLDASLMVGQDSYARDMVWQGYEWDEFGVTPRYRSTTTEERAMGWPAQVPVYNSANVGTHDWEDDVTRQGLTNIHQISLSSGTDNSILYMSLGYYNQLGVQKDQDFKRYTINVNGEVSPTKWLTFGISTIGSFSIQNFGFMGPNTSNTGSKDIYSRAVSQFPYAVPRDENGNLIKNPGGNLQLWNPVMDIDQALNERRTLSVMPNIFAEVKFTEWLKYRANFGTQIRNYRNGSWTGPGSSNHLTLRPNTAGMGREENTSWVIENLLYAEKTFRDHSFLLTLLQSAQSSRREGLSMGVSGTLIPASLWYDLPSNANGSPDTYGTSFTENTLQSYMARLNYSFHNKYLLTATVRRDGSSVLAVDHKWDVFPSFSVAWKMHEEGFLRSIEPVNELKLRFSYGVTGNSSVEPYTTSGPLSWNPYVFGGEAAIGYLPQLAQNPLLAWEKTAQWNVGLDFGLFGSRVTGTVEVYNMKTTDLLFARSLPAVTGYVQKYENIGSTQNKGLEITISSINIEKNDFSWRTDFNFSTNKEEILELVDGKEDMIANNLFIGQPILVFYDYENDGIWQNTPEDLDEMEQFNANGHKFFPGTIKVVDQNGDYKINSDDRVVVGSPNPKWSAGITNTFAYKNWSLSFMAYGRFGQTYIGGAPNVGGQYPNGRYETDFWDWDNPGGRWPLPYIGSGVENYTNSMQFIDGSFVTVRHITLGYEFPQSVISRLKMNNLHLSAQVVNPFIFGGDALKLGINPDDDTNWERRNASGDILGGMNNNTVLAQSLVFSLKVGF